MARENFDDLTDVYDAMIDWPKRLAHEATFFRRWFDLAEVDRVLDAACGTGRHAAMFHGWNLQVEAADVSPRMIEAARAQFGEPAGLQWTVRAFDQPINPPKPFDAAICVGNSLALAADRPAAFRAVQCMLDALRPGGLLIVQVLNLWRLSDGPCVWQKCLRTRLPGGDAIIVKGVHRCGEEGYVEVLVADPAGNLLGSESVRFLGFEAADLEQAGASVVLFFGGHHERPFERSESADLLMLARK